MAKDASIYGPLHAALFMHEKTSELMELLGLARWGAVGVLGSLWMACWVQCPSGRLKGWSAKDIARNIAWEGDADELVRAFEKTRFLDRDEHGVLHIHEWNFYGGATIQAIKNKKNPPWKNKGEVPQEHAAQSGSAGFSASAHTHGGGEADSDRNSSSSLLPSSFGFFDGRNSGEGMQGERPAAEPTHPTIDEVLAMPSGHGIHTFEKWWLKKCPLWSRADLVFHMAARWKAWGTKRSPWPPLDLALPRIQAWIYEEHKKELLNANAVSRGQQQGTLAGGTTSHLEPGEKLARQDWQRRMAKRDDVPRDFPDYWSIYAEHYLNGGESLADAPVAERRTERASWIPTEAECQKVESERANSESAPDFQVTYAAAMEAAKKKLAEEKAQAAGKAA